MDEKIAESNIVAGEAINKAAQELIAKAMEECANAYTLGFCRGIATIIVVGGAGGDITKEASKNIFSILGPQLSPSMQSEIARVIKELTAMVQHQVENLDKKPN